MPEPTRAELKALLAAREQELAGLREALAAAQGVLRTINGGAGDAQAVLDAIVTDASRLLGGATVGLQLRFGDATRNVAWVHGQPGCRRGSLAAPGPPIPATDGTVSGRAMRERRLITVDDAVVPTEYPDLHAAELALGRDGVPPRVAATCPLLRRGEPVGILHASRCEPRPFSPDEARLLETFADQAVIAIENSRLFKELQERLEEQTATSEVLRVISESPTDLRTALDAICASAARLCGAPDVALGLHESRGYRIVAGHGPLPKPALDDGQPRPLDMSSLYGQIALTGSRVHTANVAAEPSLPEALRHFYVSSGIKAFLGVPLKRRGEVVGSIVLRSAEPTLFSDRQVALLETFADQAVIAIENARLFRELNESNAGLRNALDQQTATSEVLATISRSPTDVQAVLDTIADTAARLCSTDSTLIFLVDGESMRRVAGVNTAGYRARLDDPSGRRAALSRRETAAHRAILDGAVVHIEDLGAVPVEDLRAELARRNGVRSWLAVPLLREGRAVGAITLARTRVCPFTEREIALIGTFADQAVIAIENSRLFAELQERLEEQTATAEVLASISHAPTDLQTVLDTIGQSAMRLCGGHRASIYYGPADDPRLLSSTGAGTGGPTSAVGDRRPFYERSPSRHVYATGNVFHSSDVRHDERLSDDYRRDSAEAGRTALMAAPLVAAGEVRGVLSVQRPEPRAFTERQVALIRTFADQAVIAVENARLFQELNESNASLREALTQQTATAEVLQAISRSAFDLEPVLGTLVENAAKLCGAEVGIIWNLDGDVLRPGANHGASADLLALIEAHPLRLDRRTCAGRAAVERRVVHLPDPSADPDYGRSDALRADGVRSILGVPLLRGDDLLGVITVWRRHPEPFAERQIALLRTFADQAVIAMENARLFAELQERNEDLAGSLAHERAVGEILRVINASPTDMQPVFQAIADHAEALLDRTAVALLLHEERTVVTVARGPVASAVLPTMPEGGNRYPADDLRTMPGKVSARKRTVHLPDVQAHADPTDPDHDPVGLAMGVRTVVGVPLWRDGEVTGVIIATRREVRPFTDREIALVETFARQAAIALANADLLRALRERTAELTASVGRLTALFEVSGAVSATLDLDRVLQTVVQRAAGLAGAEAGTIYVFESEAGVFEPRANHGLPAGLAEALREARIRVGEGPVGQAAADRGPVQVPDLDALGDDTAAARALGEAGFRALLAVPLLREQAIVGALVVRRKTAGEFAAGTVELLQTFAAQSALAIQNARLFQELAVKSQQLEEASRHKSEFLANMSHELRTPLNAIIGFTEVLLERYFGEVNEKQEDYLKDVLSSGQHLLALINDILDLSKVEAGRMELEVAPFDLGHALEAGLVMVKERASKKGIDLSLDVAEDVGRVEADERKVKQVLFNLLTNAVKFTPEGGTVTVSAKRADGRVEVAVQDTGVGIASEDIGRVFEEFGQAKNQQGQTEGTGLGLALVKRFVELHGGLVSVESAVGRGSRFAFTMPVAQPARA